MSSKELELTQQFQAALSAAGGLAWVDTAEDAAEAKKWAATLTLTSTAPTLFSDADVLFCLGRICSSSTGNALVTPETDREIRLYWSYIASLLLGGSADQKTALRDLAVRVVVEQHYAVCRPPLFDLFAHLSASEMFFIDGDSLVLEALCKPMVDWDLTQPLQVNFLAQRILQELVCRGAHFHVIFLDSGRWLWEKCPQKQLIREMICDNLLNLSAKGSLPFVVKSFPSWWSPEYVAHFTSFDPEFVMMTDGEQMNRQTPQQSSYALDADSEQSFRSVVEDEAVGTDAALYYHCFMIQTIARHAQVVYSSRLIFKDNGIVAFVVRSSSDRFAQYLVLEDDVVAVAKAVTRQVQIHPSAVSAAQKAELSKADGLFVSFTERVIAVAIVKYLDAAERTEMEYGFCEALLTTAVALSSIPAECRSQSVVKNSLVRDFLSSLAPFVLSAFKLVGPATGGGCEFDIIDGHLLYAVARILKSKSVTEVLSEDLALAVADIWRLFIGDTTDFTTKPIAELPSLDKPPSAKPLSVKMYSHELITSLSTTLDVDRLEENSAVEVETMPKGADSFGALANLKGWKAVEGFDDHNDVINVGKVEDDLEEQRRSEKKSNRARDFERGLAVAFREAAESLDAKAFLGSGEQLTVVADRSDNQQQEVRERPRHNAPARGRVVRSAADVIRQQNNLRLMSTSLGRLLTNIKASLRISDAYSMTTPSKDRDLAVFNLKTILANGFETPGKLINDDEVDNASSISTVTIWRALVDLAGKSEPDFALDQNLAVFTTSTQYVTDEYRRLKKAGTDCKDCLLSCIFLTEGKKGVTFRDEAEALDVASRFVQQLCVPFVEAHYFAAVEMRLLRLAYFDFQVERESARSMHLIPNAKKAVHLFERVQAVLNRLERTPIRPLVDDINRLRASVALLEFPEFYRKQIDAAIQQYQGQSVGAFPSELMPRHQLYTAKKDHTVARFQLCEMGERLERPVPAYGDDRVYFKPDAWQKELLDLVDRRGSAVVCAPTSAGKTFISFYCMKAALMTSNDKVVVYVAPTRALINQAVADVYARFGQKPYPNTSAHMHVYGALGGDDYHFNHDKCQVLITLPQVFETMLMSPKYAELTKKIDYVIFDEIHSMESSGNGPVWERILSLTTAPFVALSATVGETTQLCDWLNRIQAKVKQYNTAKGLDVAIRDYNVSIIPGKGGKIQRWNDIEKYVYQPPIGTDIELERTDAEFPFSHVKHLHPLSTVSIEMLRGKFPEDLSLVPKESVELYDVMLECLTKAPIFPDDTATLFGEYGDLEPIAEMKTALDRLKPETYFQSERRIVQRRAREYEAEIKRELQLWASLGVDKSKFADCGLTTAELNGLLSAVNKVVSLVLSKFRQELEQGENDLKSFSLAAKDSAKAPFPDSFAFVQKNIVNVLLELKQKDLRPTIVFSFETEDCERLVEYVVEQLEHAESVYRQSAAFESYRASMAAAKENAERRKQAAVAARSNQRKFETTEGENGQVERRDVERVDVTVQDEDPSQYDIPEILPEFCLFGKGSMNADTIKKILEDCEKQGADLFARAAKRGICMHHAGVPGKLRNHAEKLFRALRCSVIFATETLALGVHSPCRSVVLAGDHILLNTTQFRQMMGRAGRRGLDNLGHLIFMGVSLKKINRLMTSDLMRMKGHVQVDSMTHLRCLQLHDFEAFHPEMRRQQLKADAQLIASRIFTNPLFVLGRERLAGGNIEGLQVRLMQAMLRLYNGEGLYLADNPSSIGSLVTNVLHVFRNSSCGVSGIVFAHLLTSGMLRDAKLAGVEDAAESSFEAVSEALSYCFTTNSLFGIPQEVHRSVLRAEITAVVSNGKVNKAHRVALSPLRSIGLRRLHSQRSAVMQLISWFYSTEGKRLAAHDGSLPFMTKRASVFGKSSEVILDLLEETAIPFAARHPVAAICGSGDAFHNLEELCLTLRDGLFADIGMFPWIDFADNSRHEVAQVLVNAVVSDFIRVGAQLENGEYRRTLLQTRNGLTQSESFHILDHAEVILSNLAVKKVAEESHVRETLLAIQPSAEPDDVTMKILDVCEKLSGLRRQIDNQAWRDRDDERRERERAEWARIKEARAR